VPVSQQLEADEAEAEKHRESATDGLGEARGGSARRLSGGAAAARSAWAQGPRRRRRSGAAPAAPPSLHRRAAAAPGRRAAPLRASPHLQRRARARAERAGDAHVCQYGPPHRKHSVHKAVELALAQAAAALALAVLLVVVLLLVLLLRPRLRRQKGVDQDREKAGLALGRRGGRVRAAGGGRGRGGRGGGREAERGRCEGEPEQAAAGAAAAGRACGAAGREWRFATGWRTRVGKVGAGKRAVRTPGKRLTRVVAVVATVAASSPLGTRHRAAAAGAVATEAEHRPSCSGSAHADPATPTRSGRWAQRPQRMRPEDHGPYSGLRCGVASIRNRALVETGAQGFSRVSK
jgi:hypothetical protein